MKQQQQRMDSNSLSGKDKAKLLKAMKSNNPGTTSSIRPSAAGSSNSLSHASSNPNPAAQAQTVPKGFYDDDEDFKESSKSTASFPVEVKPITTVTPAVQSNSALPSGFYDDPEQDMIAHGISKYAFETAKEKVINEDLSLFLGEIEQITEETGLEEAAESELQSRLQEDDDSALQMTYMIKLAGLLKKSATANLSKTKPVVEIPEGLDVAVAEAEAMSALVKVDDTGSQRLVSSTTTLSQVEDIMRKKRKITNVDIYAKTSILQLEKRQRYDTASSHTKQEEEDEDREEEGSDEEEYDPLSFF